MKVVDFLSREAVVANIGAKWKAGVIDELAAAVSGVAGLPSEDIAKVLIGRERLGSTGIGDGVAIPHGNLPALKRLTAAFGRSVEGVSFDSVDGQPTHLFFVLLTPENAVGLQALARVSRLMRDAEFRQRLLVAKDADEIYAVLQEGDARP